MLQIQTIPSRQDNYIWLIKHENLAVVIDPGEAHPVLERLAQQQLSLKAILITHHHYDHVDGVPELLQAFPDCKIYGPQIELPNHTPFTKVNEGEQIEIPEMNLQFNVWHTPGHTAEHIIFHGHGALFCGDTLFSGGCGRVFTGTMEELHSSLMRIKTLPDDTLVYAAHEYTYNNLCFCHLVEPDNQYISQYITEVSKLRKQGVPSLPSTIEREKKCNVFLRTDSPAVAYFAQNSTDQHLKNELQVFTILREKKNNL